MGQVTSAAHITYQMKAGNFKETFTGRNQQIRLNQDVSFITKYILSFHQSVLTYNTMRNILKIVTNSMVQHCPCDPSGIAAIAFYGIQRYSTVFTRACHLCTL
jgi:hypothetical protein